MRSFLYRGGARRRPAGEHTLSAEAAQAREWSGEAREAPAQAAEGPGLRGRRGIPNGDGSHPAQPASVQAHVGLSWVSEAAFDAALASKDQATVQRDFDIIDFTRFDNAWRGNRRQSFGPM